MAKPAVKKVEELLNSNNLEDTLRSLSWVKEEPTARATISDHRLTITYKQCRGSGVIGDQYLFAVDRKNYLTYLVLNNTPNDTNGYLAHIYNTAQVPLRKHYPRNCLPDALDAQPTPLSPELGVLD